MWEFFPSGGPPPPCLGMTRLFEGKNHVFFCILGGVSHVKNSKKWKWDSGRPPPCFFQNFPVFGGERPLLQIVEYDLAEAFLIKMYGLRTGGVCIGGWRSVCPPQERTLGDTESVSILVDSMTAGKPTTMIINHSGTIQNNDNNLRQKKKRKSQQNRIGDKIA